MFWRGLPYGLLNALRIFTCSNPVRAGSWRLVALYVVSLFVLGFLVVGFALDTTFLVIFCCVATCCFFYKLQSVWFLAGVSRGTGRMGRVCTSRTQTSLKKLKCYWGVILFYMPSCLLGGLSVVNWEISSKAHMGGGGGTLRNTCCGFRTSVNLRLLLWRWTQIGM
jgi:hypothetical protein